MLERLFMRVRAVFQRRRVAREIDDELQFHLAAEVDARVRAGHSAQEARRLALLSLGGVDQTKEIVRDLRPMPLEWLWLDVRDALRTIRSKPAFSALAIATLAFGIGVNVASFAITQGLLIDALPYPAPERLVTIYNNGFSPERLQQWLPRLQTLAPVAAYYRRDVTVLAAGRAHVVAGAFVTPGFFDVLQLPPLAGRAWLPADDTGLIVSARVLERLGFPDMRHAVGAVLGVSGKPRTILAVLPANFAFPDDEVGVWLHARTLVPGTRTEDTGFSTIVGRMKHDLSLSQVRADTERIRLEVTPNSQEKIAVEPVGEAVVGPLRGLLAVALAGALLVLLVACANVATLFVGRAIARQREMAARMALGATPRQLARCVLVESGVIALCAAIAGIVLGSAALDLFARYATVGVPGLHNVGMGPRVLLAIAGLIVLATSLCAMIPVWRAAHTQFAPFLRTSTGSRPRAWRTRATLVVVQIALSLVLLIGAALLARTNAQILGQDPGFTPAGVVEAKIVLSDYVLFDGAGREDFLDRMLTRVRALPGVEVAAFGTNLPPRSAPVTVVFRMIDKGRDETSALRVGSGTSGYMRALGAHFIRGRDFEAHDDTATSAVAVINETAARFFFPSSDPVGQILPTMPRLLGGAKPQVIGVVRDMRHDGLDAPPPKAIFVTWRTRPLGSGYLIVRAKRDAETLKQELRAVIQTLDPTIPVVEVLTATEVMALSIANRRARALPPIGFGVLALALSLVGVLATLSTLMGERRRDLAIRSALGAKPRELSWSILRPGLLMTGGGLVLGVATALATVKSLTPLLYGVSVYDPVAFTAVPMLVGSLTLVMAYAASLRARRAAPAEVLKE